MFLCRDKFSIPLDKNQESDCLFLLVSVLADCLFQGIRAFYRGYCIYRHSVLPVVRVPNRERRLLETMQLAIGEFITDSSQGLPPSPRMWGWKAPSPSSLRYLLGTIISWHKWIGYTVGSWCKRIGYTVWRQFLLAQRGAFSFPLIGSLFFLLGICWLASFRRPDNYVTPGNQGFS